MDLKTPLNKTAGIGPSLSYKLSRLNLNTVEDLIYHFPFRYDDFSNNTSVLEAKIGDIVTLQGEIWSIKNIYTRSRKVLTQAIFNDGTTPIELTWFNQSWLTKQILTGDRLQISGKISKYKNKLSIMVPQWEKIDNLQSTSRKTINTGRLAPIYPETEGLSSRWFRKKIVDLNPLITSIADPLPDSIKNGMVSLSDALEKIHFPSSWEDIDKARERLGFDELFYVLLATQKAREEWKNQPLIKSLKINTNDLASFIKLLPFTLTSAQQRVLKEILGDLKKTKPMNRLIQGEVGSGKTVVAAAISYLVYKNGLKVLFMAPTEILAFQHFETLKELLEPLGVSIGIYTGSKKFTTINDLRLKIKEKNHQSSIINRQSAPDIIIGTHALLSDKLLTQDIGLIIVDEQQRFGVEQRTILRRKSKIPHFLTMTATPIPRSLALTLYGDLDLSIIDEMPKDRMKVKTYVVPEKKRNDAYKFIEKKIKEGDQAYIITPLIELSETLTSAKAAMEEFKRLQEKVFPHLKLGLLHGRMKGKEKDEIMTKFKNKEIDILVSTSVVEVGVDISNATIMVIESADRFGLAQLHQLRGRVGRGQKQSFCLLFAESRETGAIQRLKNLEKIDNGLKLSELDLKIRGSGEVFGVRQSGRFEFKIASFSNLSLLKKTKQASSNLLSKDPELDNYPLLKAKLQNLASIKAMPD